jgi:hypothetical protein
VHTQWTETRATPNRGQEAVRHKIADIEKGLPFAILGFDTDNGGEFLNWHLVDYFQKREKPMAFTRSRAYRKNDNARVEQKNRTHVRELIGYGRLEGDEVAEALNDLYAKEWSLFRNFFCPVIKLVRTEVKGSRRRRVYDEAMTPFDRLKACKTISPKELYRLERKLAELDPLMLREDIEGKQVHDKNQGSSGFFFFAPENCSNIYYICKAPPPLNFTLVAANSFPKSKTSIKSDVAPSPNNSLRPFSRMAPKSSVGSTLSTPSRTRADTPFPAA